MYKNKTVSIVFPAYNEEKNIRRAVEEFLGVDVVDEVVVVDNNSKDRTAEEVKQTKGRLVSETRQGYGFALRRGMYEATGDFIILCEPDGTFMAKDIYKLLAYADDFEMVCGTRTTKELVWHQANMGWFMRVGNWAVAKLLAFLHDGPSLSDCGCTFRLIHREALQRFQWCLTVGKSHFLPEMVILALHSKVRLIEIPVNYRSRVGVSKITGTLKGTLVTGFRMIGLILRYWVRQPNTSQPHALEFQP
jgi:glycosyltransferase involved in cell wall biosynthesis